MNQHFQSANEIVTLFKEHYQRDKHLNEMACPKELIPEVRQYQTFGCSHDNASRETIIEMARRMSQFPTRWINVGPGWPYEEKFAHGYDVYLYGDWEPRLTIGFVGGCWRVEVGFRQAGILLIPREKTP